jgi:hypothetical protein
MDESAASVAHEPSHVRLGAVGIGTALAVVGIVLALAAPWLVIAHGASPVNAPNDAVQPRIAGPVQRTAPPLELEALMREKSARLHGQGVDPATGRAYIPIEQAMREMVEQGR